MLFQVLLTTNKTAGAGKTGSILVIGDSVRDPLISIHSAFITMFRGAHAKLRLFQLTCSGEHTGVMQEIAKNDSMILQLVGTRGPTLTNRHEGRGGFTVHDYATSGRPCVHFFVSGVKVPPGGKPETAQPGEDASFCRAVPLLLLPPAATSADHRSELRTVLCRRGRGLDDRRDRLLHADLRLDFLGQQPDKRQ